MAGGEPRLLDVFASWCIPARPSAQLAELARRGVEIDGIAIRNRREDVAAFLARNGNPFTRTYSARTMSARCKWRSARRVCPSLRHRWQGPDPLPAHMAIPAEQLPLIMAKLKEAGL